MKFARILYNDEIYYAKYDSSSNMFELIEGDIFDFFSYTSTNVNRNEVKILPPCEPSKIVAVGLNYANHANENKPLNIRFRVSNITIRII